MRYIVAIRMTDIFLVGPFHSDTEAADYGATAQIKLWEDDPRWNTIILADTFGLRVEAPADIGVEPGAYRRACMPAAA